MITENEHVYIDLGNALFQRELDLVIHPIMIFSGCRWRDGTWKKAPVTHQMAELGLFKHSGVGGYSYMHEPLWWSGMIAMIVGEIANFAAYAFAPAVLVTPLGALSIIVSAALAHLILKERLHILGMLGCVLCVVGSVTIVLHAPKERTIVSVKEIWDAANEPGFLLYASTVVSFVLLLKIRFVPRYGNTHVMVYIGICSLMGSLSVMSVKALGIALKLTFEGMNQLVYPETWVFLMVVMTCVLVQIAYLNKALDTFNTAIVSPIYYVMFTSFTILASIIMFKDWEGQTPDAIISKLCGFLTILSGTFLLHVTKDLGDNALTSGMSIYTGMSPAVSSRLSIEIGGFRHFEDTDREETPLRWQERSGNHL